MTVVDKFQELAGIRFVDYNGDIEIGEWNTADGYQAYVITADSQNLSWENDVYYYQPDFDTIMKYIEDYKDIDDILNIECYDIEEYFDEYYMLDYIQERMDEDEFEEWSNAQ